MPQLRIDADGFNLNSTWSCWYKYDVNNDYAYSQGQTKATEATKNVTFAFELPARAEIISAKVHSKWSGTFSGIDVNTINGVEPDADGFVTIDGVEASALSVDVEFLFVAERDDLEEHVGGMSWNDPDIWPDNQTTPKYLPHTSSAIISEVYLLIEYEEDKGGYIYHAENGVLVPYNFYRAEGGVLVPYYMFGAPYDYELVTQNLLTADGENLRTADDEQFKVLGGE